MSDPDSIHDSREIEIIFLCNLARLNGKKFEASFLKEYLDTTTSTYERKYVSSLKSDLKKVSGLPPFQPDVALEEEARRHATDLGKAGKYGHNTSGGKSADTRFKKFETSYSYLGENCHYGSRDPLVIVIELLIDNKVSNLGHRKAILDPNFRNIGVAIEPHQRAKWNAVMDFGTRMQ